MLNESFKFIDCVQVNDLINFIIDCEGDFKMISMRLTRTTDHTYEEEYLKINKNINNKYFLIFLLIFKYIKKFFNYFYI